MKQGFILLGFLFLGIGIVGTVLPVLPTVPFLLAASFFFAKGSDRINNWFKSTGIYQKHLEEFSKSRSMTLKAKGKILALASSMLMAAFVFSKSIYARILILLVIVAKYYYMIIGVKTIRRDDPQKSEADTDAFGKAHTPDRLTE